MMSNASEIDRDRIEAALEEETLGINPDTGLPWGWDEEEEDALLDELPPLGELVTTSES